MASKLLYAKRFLSSFFHCSFFQVLDLLIIKLCKNIILINNSRTANSLKNCNVIGFLRQFASGCIHHFAQNWWSFWDSATKHAQFWFEVDFPLKDTYTDQIYIYILETIIFLISYTINDRMVTIYRTDSVTGRIYKQYLTLGYHFLKI